LRGSGAPPIRREARGRDLGRAGARTRHTGDRKDKERGAMGGGERSLGSVLVGKGLLSQERLDTALAAQASGGKRLGEILVEMGYLGEEALRWGLAEQMDLPLVHPEVEALDPEALRLLPPDMCRRYGVLPLFLSAEGPGSEPVLTLAAADPGKRETIEDVSARASRPVRVVAALREEIEAALSRVYGPAPEADVGIRSSQIPRTRWDEIFEDPTGNLLLRSLLESAIERGTGGLNLRVRNGELQVEDFEGQILFAGGETWLTILLDRLRQLAAVAGRTPGVLQRGRFFFTREGTEEPFLFRVSILRGLEGEEAQIRLLPNEGAGRTLSELGFTAHQAIEVRSALARPGLFWATAGGEEGLASTLFAFLREIPNRGRTVTLEEEIAYRSPGFLQLETLNLTGSGRTQVLRELRQLDVGRIMVDRVSPAQLGHLLALALRKRWVLAASSEGSLPEALGVLAARALELPLYGLRMVVHQRLVPLLCPGCKVACVLGTGDQQAISRLVPAPGTVFQEGDGCSRCGGRGTMGAKAFFEILTVDAPVREALYGEARGEKRIEALCERVKPSIRAQVAEAVARGEIGLSELWDGV